MLIKCADIGHLAVSPKTHKRWALQLEEEFFRQVRGPLTHSSPGCATSDQRCVREERHPAKMLYGHVTDHDMWAADSSLSLWTTACAMLLLVMVLGFAHCAVHCYDVLTQASRSVYREAAVSCATLLNSLRLYDVLGCPVLLVEQAMRCGILCCAVLCCAETC